MAIHVALCLCLGTERVRLAAISRSHADGDFFFCLEAGEKAGWLLSVFSSFFSCGGDWGAHVVQSDVFLMTIPVEPSDLTRFSRMQAAGFSQEGISRLKRLAALCRRATSMPVSKRMDIRVHRRPCTLSVHQFAMDILTRIHQSLPAIGFQPGVIHLMERLAWCVCLSLYNTYMYIRRDSTYVRTRVPFFSSVADVVLQDIWELSFLVCAIE